MSISTLYNMVNYKAQFPYLFSRYIREYDIQKANISILYSKGLIDRATYERLLISSREDRQIEIGLMIKYDKKISDELKKGIIEAKKMLFEANNLLDSDILCIKNDAVFVIDKMLKYTDFGLIKFVLKNEFTSYMSLDNGKIECYYFHDRINETELYEVKGLGNSYIYHDEYMSDWIRFIFYEIESGRIESTIGNIYNFYLDYINLYLDIGYYREFNSESLFAINNSIYKIFSIQNREDLRHVNIMYNLNIIRTIYQYITNIYFMNKR